MSADIKTWQERCAIALPDMDLKWLQPSYQIEEMKAEIADLRAELARRPAVVSEGQAVADEDAAFNSAFAGCQYGANETEHAKYWFVSGYRSARPAAPAPAAPSEDSGERAGS